MTLQKLKRRIWINSNFKNRIFSNENVHSKVSLKKRLLRKKRQDVKLKLNLMLKEEAPKFYLQRNIECSCSDTRQDNLIILIWRSLKLRLQHTKKRLEGMNNNIWESIRTQLWQELWRKKSGSRKTSTLNCHKQIF